MPKTKIFKFTNSEVSIALEVDDGGIYLEFDDDASYSLTKEELFDLRDIIADAVREVQPEKKPVATISYPPGVRSYNVSTDTALGKD